MIVIFTPEQCIDGEIKTINQLFEGGLQVLHFRKPSLSFSQCKEFIKGIDEKYHDRIMLHQHHGISEIYTVKGMHLKENHRATLGNLIPEYSSFLKENNFEISSGFHSLKELHEKESFFDYVFLSPIYNSISKKGYKANPFDMNELQKGNKRIIALGGIDSTNVSKVFANGFDGAAVMGAIWKSKDPLMAYKNILEASGNLCAITNKNLF